jgi:hypothetical protein
MEPVKMDKEKLEELAKLVEGPRNLRPRQIKFDMSEKFSNTKGCLIGISALKWGVEPKAESVTKFLGLNTHEALGLFAPYGCGFSEVYAEATWLRKAAANTIRELIKTGSINANWLEIAVDQNT